MVFAFLITSVFLQTGVDAGPAQVSCNGSAVTLTATAVNPPASYVIEWEDGMAEGPYLVVLPLVTTTYRVVMRDLDTDMLYEDETRVLVHPFGADLNGDSLFNGLDWQLFFGAWGAGADMATDPDGDGRVSILDWFYFCDLETNPVNTPPELSVDGVATLKNEPVEIPYIMSDAEQANLFLVIESSPMNGSAFLVAGKLFYSPAPDFSGVDQFDVHASDGTYPSPTHRVSVTVREPETWADLYNDIFFQECKACHIDAVSGGLSLASYENAQAGGNSGPGFIVGDPSRSPLYLRVADGSMPLGRPPLTNEDIDRIRLWILAGANP